MGTPMGTEELSNECRRCGSIGGERTGDVGGEACFVFCVVQSSSEVCPFAASQAILIYCTQ